MDEKPKDQQKRGVFSGREIFYFFFVLLAFGVLAFSYSELSSDWRDQRAEKRDAKLAKIREVGSLIRGTGGYVISETQVLYHDGYHHPTNQWVIYDLKKDEITDGSYLVKALDKAGGYRDALTRPGWLSGWKGDLVFDVFTTNHERLFFQWRTSSDDFQIFDKIRIAGVSNFVAFTFIAAMENGWNFRAMVNSNGVIRSIWYAGRNGRISTNPLATNSWQGNEWAFQDGIFRTSPNFNGLTACLWIFSLTNQTVVYSNSAVKMPRSFDACWGYPVPSGKKVLWLLGIEPKFNAKLRSFLPPAFAPKPALAKWYLYSSDLKATKFNFVGTATKDFDIIGGPPGFLWGVNADSIWVTDNDAGIKRFELK